MHPYFTPDAIERFWSKVDRSGGPDACWLWQGALVSDGYGNLLVDGRSWGAHRFSSFLHHGPLEPGQEVCHNCPGGDRRDCVNPAHLWAGTHRENMLDAIKKGRSKPPTPPTSEQVLYGEAVNTCKLTTAQVADIRVRCRFGHRSQGGNVYALAAEFGVSVQTIYHIAKRQTRKRG